MGSVSLTGSDVIQIDGRILNDLADQDAVVLTFPEELAKVKAAKNGNTIYAFNNMGRLTECTIRVLVGSDDDKYLNSRMQGMINDFSAFGLITGSFSKRVGDGAGKLASSIYQMTGGIFKKQIEGKSSSEGDTEQSVAIYTISFGNSSKSIQ
jgi:hypothetical protein